MIEPFAGGGLRVELFVPRQQKHELGQLRQYFQTLGGDFPMIINQVRCVQLLRTIPAATGARTRRVREKTAEQKVTRRFMQRPHKRRDERQAVPDNLAIRHFLFNRDEEKEFCELLTSTADSFASSCVTAAAGIRHRRGGKGLKRKLRQRPNEKLVRRRLNLKWLRPALPFQPWPDAAHRRETHQRLVNDVGRHPPFFQRRQRLRQDESAV